MINVDLNQIPIISAEDAGMLIGIEANEFNEAGVYHILIGSRGEIEKFEFLSDVNEIQVHSMEELLAEYEAINEEDREEYAEMLEEFYGLSVEEDHINFGYTEEGYDVWVKIA